MDNQMNKNKGFSLIELLIAVTLLSIIMLIVSQFMSNTSWALTKAKKNQNIQTEAMEVGSQFSDTLMQATYIRVRTQDGKMYDLDTSLGSNNRKQRALTDKGSVGGDLVVDNYPNCIDNATGRQIILNDDYQLVEDDGTPYQIDVVSFRKLMKDRSANEKSLYVEPEYIYVQYKKKSTNPGVTDDITCYVIYYFKGNEVYMNRSEVSPGATDGFAAAVNSLSSKASLLTDNVSDCYFSADTEANTVFLDMLFENEKFKGYTYNYVETIVLRNSNVLTVPPQQMYKWK